MKNKGKTRYLRKINEKIKINCLKIGKTIEKNCGKIYVTLYIFSSQIFFKNKI